MISKDPYYRKNTEKTLEYYWVDFIYGIATKRWDYHPNAIDFWEWYISEDGPLGLHIKGHYYTKRCI